MSRKNSSTPLRRYCTFVRERTSNTPPPHKPRLPIMKEKMQKPSEDLNLNNIVSLQFDKAANLLNMPEGLLQQIKACNAVYRVEFPVRFGNKYELFHGWRAEHSHHKKPVKGGIRYSEFVTQDE